MAAERQHSQGQRLRALIMSFQTGTTMGAVLKNMEPGADVWDDRAKQMQHELVEEIHARRTLPGER